MKYSSLFLKIIKDISAVFLIDTNVFMFDRCVMKRIDFKCVVIIPTVIIEELKNLAKSRYGNERRRANQALKAIFGKKWKGNLKYDIVINGSSRFLYFIKSRKIYFRSDYNDKTIVALAHEINRERKECKLILLSRDIELIDKAIKKGIKAVSYERNFFQENFRENRAVAAC